MSKFKFSLLFVLFTAISIPALADDYVVKRVPAGAVAFHFVLDLKYAPGMPELVGYMAFIEGVNSPLFAGEPSKDTAYFTLRITGGMPYPSMNTMQTRGPSPYRITAIRCATATSGFARSPIKLAHATRTTGDCLESPFFVSSPQKCWRLHLW